MIRVCSVVLCALLAACEQIDTGNRGVITRFGAVDEKQGSLPEGLYFYNPFTSSIVELNTKVLRAEGVANTYTKDVQQADIKYVINYSLDRTNAHLMLRDVGVDWAAKLVPQAVEGVLKQIVGHYEATALIDKRGEATAQIQAAIKESLAPKFVVLERFEMVNIQYQKAYEHAVEEKVVAIQRAIQEANRTKQVEEQAKQQIISAQAQAESMRIRANALAQNPRLVDYEAVQKWDGKLPQYAIGGAMPFVNITPSK